MTNIWCRTCGGPIERQAYLEIDTYTFNPEDLRFNILMVCPACFAPERNIAPDASRLADRIAYYLVTKGIVRVGIKHGTKLPYPRQMDEVTSANHTSARNYISMAVRKIQRLWVSTHYHPPFADPSGRYQGYVLGHLRTKPTTCSCGMR